MSPVRTRVPRRPAGVAARRAQPREQVAEIQRARLLVGAVGAFDEHGYAHTTVGHIALRAGISRRTFYELFADREACLAALFEDVVGMIEGELASAGLGGLPWRERVRGGLWAILAFFDREPVLARVCVTISALDGNAAVVERRNGILAKLMAVVDEGRLEGARGAECTPLTAEGLVGAALAIVHTRLPRGGGGREHGEGVPLTGLLGELMGMIVLPYLGPAAARREQERSTPAPVSAGVAGEPAGAASWVTDDPLGGVAMRLTYRTAKVMEAVAELQGANNREIAERAGISDQGQVSKLLARLERLGLLANTSEGHAKGEPNAWGLTPRGEQVARSIRGHAPRRVEAA